MVKKFQRREDKGEDDDNSEEEDYNVGDLDMDDLSDLEILDPNTIPEENKENIVNDVEALEKKAEELRKEFIDYITLKGLKGKHWMETLTVTSKECIDENLNMDDDIRRELFL